MIPKEESLIYEACEALARNDCGGFRDAGARMANPVHQAAVNATTECPSLQATAVADMLLSDASMYGTMDYDSVMLSFPRMFASPAALHPSLTVAGDSRFIGRIAARAAQKALREGRPISTAGIPWVAARQPREDERTLTVDDVAHRQVAYLRGVLFYEDWVPTPSGFAALSLTLTLLLLTAILSTTWKAGRARVVEVVPEAETTKAVP